MSNSGTINSAIRFVLLLLVQVFLLRPITWGWGGEQYAFVFMYPLFIMLLPLRTPAPLVIVLAFVMGLSVDLLSETLGLHAAAATFTAYIRPLMLRLLAPRDGYNPTSQLTKAYMGDPWFVRYSGALLFLHLFFFFSVQAFTFVYIVDIIIKTLLSGIISWAFILAAVYVFNPKS